MREADELREMDEALHAANKCSYEIERLLGIVKNMGGPTPELTKKIAAANKECEQSMARYVARYNRYYNVHPTEASSRGSRNGP